MNLRSIFAVSICTFASLAVSQKMPAGFKPGMRFVPSSPQGPTFVSGEILIKFRAGATTGGLPAQIHGLPAGSSLIHPLGYMGWTLWNIPKSVDPRLVAAAIKKDPAVAYSEPVFKCHILEVDPND